MNKGEEEAGKFLIIPRRVALNRTKFRESLFLNPGRLFRSVIAREKV